MNNTIKDTLSIYHESIYPKLAGEACAIFKAHRSKKEDRPGCTGGGIQSNIKDSYL